MEDFLPFLEFQKRENDRYYKEKGIGLYDDFSTAVSACDKLAVANAREFYRFLSREKMTGEVNTCEIGIGNGNFTYFFMKELERLDKHNKTDFSKRINFILIDFSEKVLKNAGKKFKNAKNVEFLNYNADKVKLDKKILYLRANELLSDLPTLLLVKRGGKIREVFMRRVESRIEATLENMKIEKPEIVGMLDILPENYFIPFNLKALEFLKSCAKSMDWKNGAYIDIFDYGFSDLKQVFDMPKEIWNENVFREYGYQITVDVNFPFISHVLAKLKLKTRIEPQLEYMERLFGKSLYQALLDVGSREEIFYLEKEELKGYKKQLLSKGYSKEFINGEIKEEFSFYHFRVLM